MKLTVARLETPLGVLQIAGDGERLSRVLLPHEPSLPKEVAEFDADAFADARAQLSGYFAGVLREFDLRLAVPANEFQAAVRTAMQDIGYGETASYREIAERIGKPSAARAVGRAAARNPLPIVVACHRVVGSSGALTGYAGGLEAKRFLLEMETSNIV